jgi:hypothetical protein
MVSKIGLACGLAVLAVCGSAAAQERQYTVTVRPAAHVANGVQKIKLSKAAVGSSQIVIWGGAAIDPDCSPHPGSTLAVVTPPAHGEVKVVEEPIYVAFPPGNPRSACNSKKVPGRHVYYTASPGYSGHDRVVLEGSSEDGSVRHVTIDVNVLKGAG